MFIIASLLVVTLVILMSYKVLLSRDQEKAKLLINNHTQESSDNKRNDYDKLLRKNIDLEDSLQKLKKSKDKAEENDRLKSVFLANMSHEIRTPMNAIIGFSNLLLKENISEENRKEFVSLIIENGNDLLNLINDIIDISKIEAEQLKVNLTKCNLNELFRNIYLYYNDLIIRNKKLQPRVELKFTSGQDRSYQI